MRYNSFFSMLPERAFQPRPGGGMTLEGGMFGGGGGGGGDAGSQLQETVASRFKDPQPRPGYISAGGGFMGRTPFGAPGSSSSVSQDYFNSDYYLKQNPDVARDPYYGKNPFEHYQDFGFYERRSPSEGYQYAPSQQPMTNSAYVGLGARPDLIMNAYQNIAGRGPDQEGFNYWSNAMRQGMTGQGLVAGFTTSPEFQRTQEFQKAYTEAFRPGYKEFGPNQQYYQPIYQRGSSYTDYRTPMYASGPFGGSFGYGMQSPFSYTQGSYGSVASAPRAAPSNMIGGIGVGGRYAEGGEVDDNPGDDEGIRALLGRQ